jgi:hypothetical protein
MRRRPAFVIPMAAPVVRQLPEGQQEFVIGGYQPGSNGIDFYDLPHTKSSRWGGGVTSEDMQEMQWVKSELVAQIRFIERTAEGRLRHARFLALRSDKDAREVRREP